MNPSQIVTDPAEAGPITIQHPIAPERIEQVARSLARSYKRLAPLFGNQQQREETLWPHVRADRLVGAFAGETLCGYVALQFDGVGPLMPQRRALVARFGRWSGTTRWVALHLSGFRAPKPEIYIDGIVIEPAQRGTRLAVDLLDRCERIVRETGKERLRADVAVGNLRARRFFEKHGFVQSGPSRLSALSRLAGQDALLTYLKRL